MKCQKVKTATAINFKEHFQKWLLGASWTFVGTLSWWSWELFLVAETRAALLDAKQNKARAIDLKDIGKPASFDWKPVGSETSDSTSRRTEVL